MDVATIKSALLAPVRRGPASVIWPSANLGFANHLYIWQAAWMRQTSGVDCRVLHDSRMDEWLARFPHIAAALIVPRAEVKLRDVRDMHDHQVFGTDFNAEDLRGFIREFLLTSPAIEAVDSPDPGRVTVNVRRGDYYSVPRFRGWYSFDVVEYLRTALVDAEQQAEVTSVHVVSDGIDWCRDRLSWIADGGRELTFAPSTDLPFDHFVRVCTSPRLILTNSTFSYWGGYVSNVLYGQNHAAVHAPWFHRRDIDGGRAWQLDPRWSVVREIKGGWDA